MKKQMLYFRFTSDDGASLAASALKESDNSYLWDKSDWTVRRALTYLHEDLKPAKGLTPEVWSQDTVDRFEAMEEMIQRLRNLMNDSAVDQDGEWGEAIDAADKLLGLAP